MNYISSSRELIRFKGYFRLDRCFLRDDYVDTLYYRLDSINLGLKPYPPDVRLYRAFVNALPVPLRVDFVDVDITINIAPNDTSKIWDSGKRDAVELLHRGFQSPFYFESSSLGHKQRLTIFHIQVLSDSRVLRSYNAKDVVLLTSQEYWPKEARTSIFNFYAYQNSLKLYDLSDTVYYKLDSVNLYLK